MIRKLIERVLARAHKTRSPIVIGRERHGIGRERISSGARRVAATLHEHGHAAYVVGGAVRDLLLGREPKDFDIATDATPERVHALFRRSRIIGRRFRIVHVMVGGETVEVTTFRAAAGDGECADSQRADENGRLLRDNVFGTQQEDAARRDFTINALFYDPATEQIVDYHGGVADLERRRLRMIGDPQTRYREDPVRMLRAVRFAATHGFTIEPKTRAPIAALAGLLANVPGARLFDEMLKLLLSGQARGAVQKLRDEGLQHGLLPMLDVILEQPLGERFVMAALASTDERVNAGKPVSPAFLFAALLWHEVLAGWKANERAGKPPAVALDEAMDQVIAQQVERLAIPRRYTAQMRELWWLQPRFLQRSGKRPYRLLGLERFRAGYDFLLLRCASGEVEAEVGEWWARFQDAGEAERERMLAAQPAQTGTGRRRRRRRGAGSSAPARDAAAAGGVE
jgi:poly(A) polymerase